MQEPPALGTEPAAIARSAAPSLSASSTAFVISSTNSGMPSVRSMMSCRILAGSDLFPTTPLIIAPMSRSPSRLMVRARDVRPSDPRRLELGPERDDQQYAEGLVFGLRFDRTLEARRIDPMCILENHQHRILA